MKEKGDLKFEFGRRINRPSEWNTNPFPDISDGSLIHQGNPYLKPEDIYKCEFTYSNRLPIGYLSAGIYFSRTTNLIDRHKYNKTYNDDIYQKILFFIILLLCFNTKIALAGYPETTSDYMLLPPFCKARASNSSTPNYKKWEKKLGHDFLHTHHYCASLHSLRIARSMFPSNRVEQQDKKGLLAFVFDNIKYMEGHAKSTYVLFPHIYTTQAEAYLEAKQPLQAIKYFNKSIQANKKFTKPYALLSDYYKSIKNKKKAISILKEGLKYSPKSRALNKRLAKLSK